MVGGRVVDGGVMVWRVAAMPTAMAMAMRSGVINLAERTNSTDQLTKEHRPCLRSLNQPCLMTVIPRH